MTADDWARIKAIALEAWARPQEERARYITSACDADESLRREVSSLVASMAAAEAHFEAVSAWPAAGNGQGESLTGQRVGAYEVLSFIGAGGMGEVYKARDTRLDRTVAIKILPARLGDDPWSRERVTREARAVAALNHPHICTVHDIGNHGGRDFFVMEFVDGESLSTRLSRGTLPVAEAFQYAEEVASALVEAHAAGIIHRDVKPANIMLHRASGGTSSAKLLDFGVAKGRSPQAAPASAGTDTAALDLTAVGIVVGTAHYMAPEQLDRQAADARSDIFAFGAVLFEMLTGRKAFHGTDRSEVLAAIRAGQPPRPSEVRDQLPSLIDRVVMRCLARDPAERYQTSEALLADVRRVRRRLDSSQRGREFALAAAVVLMVIAATIAWRARDGHSETSQVAPSLTRLPLSAGVIGAPALSPDGSQVVFPWTGDGIDNPELVLLAVDSTSRTRLTNDPGVEEWPVWSPRGDTIAFVRCGSGKCAILTRSLDEAAERKLLDLPDDRYYGLAWSPDGETIAYAARSAVSEPYALFLLSVHGGVTRRLTSPGRGTVLRVAFSPDSRTLALVGTAADGLTVHLLALDTGRTTTLLSGYQEWIGGITWNADGRSLVLSANRQGVRRLWILPTTGGDLRQISTAGEDAYYPSTSRQGNRLIFVREFGDWDISRATIAGRRLREAAPFPSSPRIDLDPAFSPDGRTLAFVSERSGTRELWVSRADGTNAQQRTSLNGALTGRPSWSPDGRSIAFHANGIHVIPSEGGASHKLVEDGESPAWSSDGRSIYFVRSVAGAFRVLKVPVEGGEAASVLASEAWSVRAGRHELYVAKKNGGIWAVASSSAADEPIVNDFTSSLPGYWTLFDDGIYYVVRESLPDNTFIHRLKFFDFARRRSVEIGKLPGTIEHWVGGMTISPDRRTVLYSNRTYQSSEIMLMEHFR